MNHLNTAQEEQLKTIGTYLRNCREEQEKSIEEIALKTFISLRSLKALEAGQFDELPEPVFVQGFIRRYAETLNLDSKRLMESFATEVVPKPAEDDEAQAEERDSAPVSRSHQPILFYIGMSGIAAITLLGLLVYLVNQVFKPQPSIPAPVQKSPQIEQPLTQNQSPVASTPASTASKSAFPVDIAVEVKAESWVRVIADGKTEFEGILTQSDRPMTWNAQQELKIRAGNAGALWISFNQKTAKPLGKMGEVKDITFTPNQDW